LFWFNLFTTLLKEQQAFDIFAKESRNPGETDVLTHGYVSQQQQTMEHHS